MVTGAAPADAPWLGALAAAAFAGSEREPGVPADYLPIATGSSAEQTLAEVAEAFGQDGRVR